MQGRAEWEAFTASCATKT